MITRPNSDKFLGRNQNRSESHNGETKKVESGIGKILDDLKKQGMNTTVGKFKLRRQVTENIPPPDTITPHEKGNSLSVSGQINSSVDQKDKRLTELGIKGEALLDALKQLKDTEKYLEEECVALGETTYKYQIGTPEFEEEEEKLNKQTDELGAKMKECFNKILATQAKLENIEQEGNNIIKSTESCDHPVTLQSE